MVSEIKVNTLSHTGGTTAMTIDSTGRVLKPVIPAFRVGLGGQQNLSSEGPHDVAFDTAAEYGFLNGGCSNSSGVITVPVAGLYMVGFTISFGGATAGNYVLAQLCKNDATTGLQDLYFIEDDVSTSYQSVTNSGIFEASASDNFRVKATAESDTSWHIDDNISHFWGYLVG